MALTLDQLAMRQAPTNNPGKIDNSDRITANSAGIAAEVAVGARAGAAAAFARAFGVQRDRSADGVDVSVAHHRAGAGEVHRLALWQRHGGRRAERRICAAGHDLIFSGGRRGSITFVTILTRYRETGEKPRASVRFP